MRSKFHTPVPKGYFKVFFLRSKQFYMIKRRALRRSRNTLTTRFTIYISGQRMSPNLDILPHQWKLTDWFTNGVLRN